MRMQSGPSPRPVIDAVSTAMLEHERISETHRQAFDAVRARACRFLGCDDDELAITRSATEGMNLIARGMSLQPGDEIILTTHEHPGGAMPWVALAKQHGLTIRLFEPDPDIDRVIGRLEALLTPRTRVLAVSHITCTTGCILPLNQLSTFCRARGIILVVDGAQAVGMIPVDMHELGCDFYTASGHKWLLGPKGTGLLYIRSEMLDVWSNPVAGAHSDDGFDLDTLTYKPLRAARAVEYGTRSAPIVIGLGAAIDFAFAIGPERIAAHNRELADRFRDRLAELPGVECLTPQGAGSSAAVVTFRVINGDLDPWQICNSLKQQQRIRVRPVGEHGLNGVRASYHIFNTIDEADRLAAALRDLLRSPVSN